MSAKRATATELAAGTGDEQGVAAATPLRLMGFSVRETAAGAATAILRRGTDATGEPLAFVSLASGGAQTEWFNDGVEADGGIFVERLTGNTHWVLYTRKGQ
jgi:hypothetical protein